MVPREGLLKNLTGQYDNASAGGLFHRPRNSVAAIPARLREPRSRIRTGLFQRPCPATISTGFPNVFIAMAARRAARRVASRPQAG
jgi:hypothetical protein